MEINNKIVIYTCITGGYEKPIDNFEHKEGYDYILYSDVPIKTKSWTNRIINLDGINNLSHVKKQRYIKLHPHLLFPEYTISVWIDGNTHVIQELYDYIDKAKNSNIVFKNHPHRQCIYDELKANIQCKKETPHIVNLLTKRYQDEEMPKNFGLYETNIIVRKHNNKMCQTIMDLWFNEIKEHSHRDQLSLTYVLWKHGLKEYVDSLDTNKFPALVHKK